MKGSPTQHRGTDETTSAPASDSHREGHDDSSAGNSSGISDEMGPRPGGVDPDDIFMGSTSTTVWKTKIGVFLFLLVCTVAVAVLVNRNLRNIEQELFRDEAAEFTLKVIETLSFQVDAALGAIDAFVAPTVSFSLYANMTWPYVLLPDSGVRLSKVRTSAGSVVTSFAPIVSADNLEEWNEWSVQHAPTWVDENLRLQESDPGFFGTAFQDYNLLPVFDQLVEAPENKSFYLPKWQGYPTGSEYPFNFDLASFPNIPDLPWERKVILSEFMNSREYEGLLRNFVQEDFDVEEPFSEWYYPIFLDAISEVFTANLTEPKQSEMVGVVWSTFYWHNLLHDILPEGINGIVVVIENECDNSATYVINGPDVQFEGLDDLHDHQFDDFVLQCRFENLGDYSADNRVYTGFPPTDGKCPYTFRVYPSTVFEDRYISSKPLIYTGVAIAIFVFTSAVFGFYDFIIERRQAKVISKAAQANAIVSSLYPSSVRSRLFNLNRKANNEETLVSQKTRLKTFVHNVPNTLDESRRRRSDISTDMEHPIADLFPEATVMFGDIAGFTAWSSTRSPSQVFILLETLYGEFDRIATRRGVFKVETIGDCYLAVAGLPEPRDDHALVMVKFAHNCGAHLNQMVTRLSVQLGPDTEDLSMRFGLNSGPVTAGVLRGQKSRFQLFGDTVNTASRMESLGEKDKIHISQSTADELVKLGKGHWIRLRRDVVEVKGKGRMSTYWVEPHEHALHSSHNGEEDLSSHDHHHHDEVPVQLTFKTSITPCIDAVRIERLVAWNVDVLSRLLRGIVAHHAPNRRSILRVLGEEKQQKQHPTPLHVAGNPIDEVEEIIALPEYDRHHGHDNRNLELDPTIVEQLRKYVAAIAGTYHGAQNPFHNFEHASHVCMSVSKLMSRIVSAEHFFDKEKQGDTAPTGSVEFFKHKRTFGITSDPLTLFACGFSALIHDVDHPGVPNAQLVKEGNKYAEKYAFRSVAEQRSVDVAWELLMEDDYQELRDVICPTAEDLKRFRQLVVNSVLATDIMDPELKKLRNNRWDKAFSEEATPEQNGNHGHVVRSLVAERREANRKATIVIEHLLQASDVAHTMQHWHVYIKWNKRLFTEMHLAFVNGRAPKHPSEFWYKGEMFFFDHYIIPLAKKLSDCGVFGVSSDEYLGYALKNREEWENKGEGIVQELMSELRG
eukprot:Nitzschia sp. Nitz4//scaffold172_size47551//32245//35933//NITZ4_007146-RA/size47551-snap-gene-0.66-mRNA-1//1//CDS//3329538765//3313//frame0